MVALCRFYSKQGRDNTSVICFYRNPLSATTTLFGSCGPLFDLRSVGLYPVWCRDSPATTLRGCMLLSAVPNPDYMHGTSRPPDPNSATRFCLNSDLAEYGGMGTTGSLGVNFAAPLTRGGFRGEIFDSNPMPTAYWTPAPTPYMCGMGNEPIPQDAPPTDKKSGVGMGTIGLLAALGAAYLAFK